MSLREAKRSMIENILVNFFLITIAMGIYMRFIGHEFMPISNIFVVALMSGLTGSAELVLYSKRELRRSELLIRHIICLILGVVIVLSLAILSDWIPWNDPILIIAFVGMVIVIHVISVAIDYYRTKLKTDEMTNKIKELNR